MKHFIMVNMKVKEMKELTADEEACTVQTTDIIDIPTFLQR